MNSHFELAGEFTLDQVPEVRRFTERMLRWIPDPDVSARLAMATHELFENAVKFADDGVASLRVEVARAPSIRARITTRNRAKRADLDTLQQLSTRLRDASDPMEFYVQLMKDAPDARGGLGIGRVAAEGDMRVAMELENEHVVINAELEASA